MNYDTLVKIMPDKQVINFEVIKIIKKIMSHHVVTVIGAFLQQSENFHL